MMDCRATRDWLLQAEYPARLDDGPAGLAAHVAGCDACRRLLGELQRLEADYSALPLPASAEHARDAFLARMPIALALPPRRRFSKAIQVRAAAVLLLLVLGTTVWFLPPVPPGQQPQDLVEQLIDWNLDLADSSTADERQHLHDEQARPLRSAVEHAGLPAADRDLAETLLETGEFIATTQADPMTQADRFNDLADKLVALIDAANKKDAKRLLKLAGYYRRIADEGIEANLQRAEQNDAKGPTRKKRDKVLRRAADRADQLMRLLEDLPSATRKDVRRALDSTRKPQRQRKQRKQ
jgi:hypothetical protein